LRQECRAAEANESRRFPAQFGHAVEGGLRPFDRGDRSFKEALARVSQSQGPRRALKQTDTEPLLKGSNASAEARFLYADPSCRRRKAPVDAKK
jgi:hypothetical protein